MEESQESACQAAEQQIKFATIWQTKGKLSRAIASCEKAIQLQPDYMSAYLTLTQLLAQTGERQRAINTYRQGIEMAIKKAWILPDQQQENFVDRETPIERARNDYREAIRQRAENGEPPRILLYTNCPGTYGAEQISHALMVRLVRLGYKVTCVQSQAKHHLIQAREAQGIEHIWLKDDAYQFGYTVGNALEVAEIFASVLPDLIIFADGNPLDNLAANWLTMLLKIPYIRIIHCVIPDWGKDYAPCLCLLLDIYKSAEVIVSVSRANLELMRESFELPEPLGQVIYNGRPDNYFAPCRHEVRKRLRQDLAIPLDAVVIFTAARMYPVKGYQHQVEVIKQLRQLPVWTRLYFVWAGSGNLETRLKADINELGVGQQVKFLGERSDIPDLLEAADIFLLPSHVEGMPLAVMEAMAKGLPVMATRISGVPEELGDTGQLLPDPTINPRATVEVIVETLQAWATDTELRQTTGRRCQQRAMAMFREERMLNSYLTLIQQVLRFNPVDNHSS